MLQKLIYQIRSTKMKELTCYCNDKKENSNNINISFDSYLSDADSHHNDILHSHYNDIYIKKIGVVIDKIDIVTIYNQINEFMVEGKYLIFKLRMELAC